MIFHSVWSSVYDVCVPPTRLSLEELTNFCNLSSNAVKASLSSYMKYNAFMPSQVVKLLNPVTVLLTRLIRSLLLSHIILPFRRSLSSIMKKNTSNAELTVVRVTTSRTDEATASFQLLERPPSQIPDHIYCNFTNLIIIHCRRYKKQYI